MQSLDVLQVETGDDDQAPPRHPLLRTKTSWASSPNRLTRTNEHSKMLEMALDQAPVKRKSEPLTPRGASKKGFHRLQEETSNLVSTVSLDSALGEDDETSFRASTFSLDAALAEGSGEGEEDKPISSKAPQGTSTRRHSAAAAVERTSFDRADREELMRSQFNATRQVLKDELLAIEQESRMRREEEEEEAKAVARASAEREAKEVCERAEREAQQLVREAADRARNVEETTRQQEQLLLQTMAEREQMQREATEIRAQSATEAALTRQLAEGCATDIRARSESEAALTLQRAESLAASLKRNVQSESAQQLIDARNRLRSRCHHMPEASSSLSPPARLSAPSTRTQEAPREETELVQHV